VASLLDPATETVIELAARHVVGRSRTCQLRLADATVSSLHAEISWDGEVWRLHDLGSRNGTLVDGQRLPAGKRVELSPGASVEFGGAACRYRFTDASPPRLLVFGPQGQRTADDDMICLPTRDACEAIVLREGAGWAIESADGTRKLAEVETVHISGQAWTIHLPVRASATRDAADTGADALRPAREETTAITFTVSRDGEHVDVVVRQDGTARAIEPRAHHFLLLSLARVRLADAAQEHLSERECGWIHREDLLKELAVDPQLLNLWVYRARRQLAQAELRGASHLIERRGGAGQLRLGIGRLEIIQS
jgi:hypothetical protein